MTSVCSLDSPDAPMRTETATERFLRLFGDVRFEQYRQLDLAFAISSRMKPLPLVIVSGPRGAGKSAVLAEVLKDEFYVSVDCASATSGMSVLSAILRRLALALRVKQVSSFATPDESPEGSPRYVHRQAFKDAARKINRDAGVPKAVKTDGKFMEICSWAEVRSLTGFKQKFESLVDSQKRVFLLIDNAHCLAEGKNFQVLNFLSCLSEVTSTSVSVILVASRNLPPEISCRACTVVQFPGYTQFQASKIITGQLLRTLAGASRPGAVLAFLPSFMLFNFPRLRDDFSILSKEASRVFSEAASSGIFDKPGDEAKLAIKNFCASKEGRQNPVKSGIPRLGKILIVASFLAAHNPPNFDSKIFSTTRGKSGRAGVSNFKKAKLDADVISVRPPKPFSLPRLLAIAEYVASGALSQSLRTLQLIRSLSQQGLLKRCGGDWLDGNLKLACHAPLSLVHAFASDIGIRLDEVLF